MKPKPVVKVRECSVCGLAWERHGKAPTVETCVELLKADLATATRPRVPLRNPVSVRPLLPSQPFVSGWQFPNVPGGLGRAN